MNISKRKLELAQENLWLAEIERESDEVLVITLAGLERIVAMEVSGLGALALTHESLDPDILPGELKVERHLQLSRVTSFEAEEEIAARLRVVALEEAEDILAASRTTWLSGTVENLKQAPLLLDLRVESWALKPHPVDLHLLLGARHLLLADEEGELDLAAHDETVTWDHHDDALPPHHEAPREPPWEVDTGDLPAELALVLQRFFEAAHRDDFAALAELAPQFDMQRDELVQYHACHFHALNDWLYGRSLEDFAVVDDLARVRIRGILHSRGEDGMETLNEECVWSFSLGRRRGRWVIRHWPTAWPSVGGAPALTPEEKPWMARWRSGPITE